MGAANGIGGQALCLLPVMVHFRLKKMQSMTLLKTMVVNTTRTVDA